jgi:hypothetical protein
VGRPKQHTQPPASGVAPPPGTLYDPGKRFTDRYPGVEHSGENPIAAHEYLLIGCLAFFVPPVGVGFAWYWSSKNRPGAENCLALAWGWLGFNLLLLILALLFGGR